MEIRVNEPVYCCDELISPTHSQSPFLRLIGVDYLDAPTNGLVQCKRRNKAYRFSMVARDINGRVDKTKWDEGLEICVFTLAPVPGNAFDDIVNTLTQVEEPRWPEWFPRWHTMTSTSKKVIEQEIDLVLNKANSPELVVASSNLLEAILAAKRMPTGVVGGIDWFSLLDLTDPP